MSKRTLGVSEARRLLPRLVESIERDGGRVDITRHGQPCVSLVRTADLSHPAVGSAREAGTALAVELCCSPDELLADIRALRDTTGVPRRPPPRRSSGRRR